MLIPTADLAARPLVSQPRLSPNGRWVLATLGTPGKPTLGQAQSLLRDSVLNLCPQQKNLLPKPEKALGASSKAGWLTQHIRVPLNR